MRRAPIFWPVLTPRAPVPCYWLGYSTIFLFMRGTFGFMRFIKILLESSCNPPPATIAGVVTQVRFSGFPERDKSLSLQGAFQPPGTL